jgi:hypothetical protein
MVWDVGVAVAVDEARVIARHELRDERLTGHHQSRLERLEAQLGGCTTALRSMERT